MEPAHLCQESRTEAHSGGCPHPLEICHALPPAPLVSQRPMGLLHPITITHLSFEDIKNSGIWNREGYPLLGHCRATWHNWEEILLVLLPSSQCKSAWFFLSSPKARETQQGFWSLAILSLFVTWSGCPTLRTMKLRCPVQGAHTWQQALQKAAEILSHGLLLPSCLGSTDLQKVSVWEMEEACEIWWGAKPSTFENPAGRLYHLCKVKNSKEATWSFIRMNDWVTSVEFVTLKQSVFNFLVVCCNFEQSLNDLSYLKDYL